MVVEITAHAMRQIASKGFDLATVEAVWRNPDYTYPSHRYPDQHKRVGGGLCLCCDNSSGRIVTVFVNQTETDLRPDQRDRDAVRYGQTRARMR